MNAPRLVLLETSGQAGHIAVARGADILGVRLLEESRRHARDLAPSVADLLHEQQWTPRTVDAVLVSRGPGSYTGLRVGIMSARTFAYATSCALIGVDTFALLAHQVASDCSAVDVLADAQKDQVYVQSFQRHQCGWTPASDLTIRAFSDWLANRDPSAWVTGPGLRKWRPQVPADVPVTPTEVWSPGIPSLLHLGLARLTAGERDDPFTLEPLYLRASSAELQWRGRS